MRSRTVGSVGRRSGLGRLASLGLLAVVLAGCSAAPTPEVTTGDAVLEQGRDVYIRQCASCHGSDGTGGRGTKFTDGAIVAAYPEVADQVAVVAEGKGSMPAFGGRLEEGELEAVVRYTREVLAVAE